MANPRMFLTGVDFTNNKGVNLASPTAATDAANKAYVDALASGLEWKQEVRVATTTAGTLATSFANGSTIDAVALVTGDRILIKNQASQIENGLYTVNVSGAPTRSLDANTTASLNNATTIVTLGTVNGNTSWTQTTPNPVIGTSNVVFVGYAAGTVYTAGNGLQLVSGAFSVLLDTNPGLSVSGTGLKAAAGTGITVTSTINVDTSVVARKFATSIGNASLLTFAVSHGLATLDVTVQVYDNGTLAQVECDVVHTSTSVVTLNFTVAPTTNQYRVLVVG